MSAMDISHIRHPWFSPIPKRKHSLDVEADWPPGAYRATKRVKALEGGFAGLTLDTGMVRPPEVDVREGAERFEAEPYMADGYDHASSYPTTASSVVSLPLKGEVSEPTTSDEEKMESVVNVDARSGMPGYVVYEPQNGKKRKWFEPEKDRIVVLDIESSEDEASTRSPRRRRSAFSLNSNAEKTTGRPRSQSQPEPEGEFVINTALLSHLPPPTPDLAIPKDDSDRAVVLFRPAPWGTGAAPLEAGETAESEPEDVVSMEASPLVSDIEEDAMDVDS